jgi:hypothetical protein
MILLGLYCIAMVLLSMSAVVKNKAAKKSGKIACIACYAPVLLFIVLTLFERG